MRQPSIQAFSAYKKVKISERHRHRFEVNNKFVKVLEKNGLVISGLSPDKELVEMIELEIGTLAGIVFDALDFVWPAAVKNTVLEKAVKKIDIIHAKGKCMECDTIFPLEYMYDPCPKCNNYLKGILQGKELRVKSLDVV